MSLEQAKRAKKGFEGSIMVALAGIVSFVLQHASLCSPVGDIPSPTSSVPIIILDESEAGCKCKALKSPTVGH